MPDSAANSCQERATADLAAARDGHDDPDRALQRPGQAGQLLVDGRLEVVDPQLHRGDPGRATASGRSASRPTRRHSPRRSRRSPRSCGSWSRGGSRDGACRRAPPRERPRLGGDRPGRLCRVADDGPGGSPPATADHPPLHRGEVLGLVDEHVGEAVVLDAVGRRGPAARAGVLPVGGGEQLVQRGVLDSEVLVVDRAGVHDRRVAEQVAQLVEQRHVVDGERAPRRDPTTWRAPAPTRRRGRPRTRGTSRSGRAASPARSRRRAPATRRRRTPGRRRRCASPRRTPPWCARGPARRAPGATSPRSGWRRPGRRPVAVPMESSWRRSAPSSRLRGRSRRRGRRTGTRGERRAPPGAPYAAAPRPSRRCP